MFDRVLVALAGHAENRDALLLGAQLADAEGTVLLAHVMATSPDRLTGGSAAASCRRERLRDAGEEIYATLGPDPRVHYLPLSGLPFEDAVRAVARREQADVIVVGQNLLGREPGARLLLSAAPCPVAVAPYGHRFAPPFAPARISVACGTPEVTDAAVRLAGGLAARPSASVRLVTLPGCGAAALLAQTQRDVDLLVIGTVDDEVLRQAACPVLVVPSLARDAHPVAAWLRL
jgi:nucleotide-binding universal stress UspA family protein